MGSVVLLDYSVKGYDKDGQGVRGCGLPTAHLREGDHVLGNVKQPGRKRENPENCLTPGPPGRSQALISTQ